jgi:hypothetical protein
VRPSRRLAKRIVRPISLIPIIEHKGRYVVVISQAKCYVPLHERFIMDLGRYLLR